MKAGKLILGSILGLVVVLVLVVVVAFFMINSIAKAGIEKGGTYALGVPTSVDSVNVDVLGGVFEMKGLEVANPAGFTSPHFLALGSGGVNVTLQSLTKDTVELPRLALDTIDVRLEKKDGKSNYNVILENLKKLSGSDPSKPAPAPGPDAKAKRFVVSDLSVTNVTVHVDLLGGPASSLTKITVPIDEIKLKNVGRTGSGVAGTGVTMSELSGIIVKAVLAAAVQNGGGLIPADVLGELQGGLAGIANLGGSLSEMGLQVVGDAKGAVEQVGKEVEKTVDEAKKTVEDIGKGIKDLIPKK